MLDAIQQGKAREAAKESLVRALNEQLPKGWNKGKQVHYKRGRALGEWVLPCEKAEDWQRVTSLADRVWQEIERLNPPDDWCPRSVNDPVLEEAFAHAWPT